MPNSVHTHLGTLQLPPRFISPRQYLKLDDRDFGIERCDEGGASSVNVTLRHPGSGQRIADATCCPNVQKIHWSWKLDGFSRPHADWCCERLVDRCDKLGGPRGQGCPSECPAFAPRDDISQCQVATIDRVLDVRSAELNHLGGRTWGRGVERE
jgi:hypothetical protein